MKIDPLLDQWFKQAAAPTLSPRALAGDAGGRHPFYRIKLQGKVAQGQLKIEQAGASTITHLLGVQGSVDLVNEQWQLDLGVLNGQHCAELLGQWRGPLAEPILSWGFQQNRTAAAGRPAYATHPKATAARSGDRHRRPRPGRRPTASR